MNKNKRMSVLVSGAQGQLGKDIVGCFSRHFDVVGLGRNDWDVTDDKKSKHLLDLYKPDVLIHCAAYTQVDISEEKPDIAYLVNVDATRTIAELCQRAGIRFVYISTDYVFNGLSPTGYVEQDFPHPLNVYGKTKRLGEKWTARCCPNHLIIRTSWLYGHHGSNFVKSILRKAELNEPLSVVTDQVGSPTFTRHLAEHLHRLLLTPATGIFHLANTGSCSWYEFAKAIIELSSTDGPIQEITTKELTRKAVRPICSILRSNRLSYFGIDPMPHWKSALEDYMRGVQ